MYKNIGKTNVIYNVVVNLFDGSFALLIGAMSLEFN
jgi:hypothetical protein